MTTKKKYMDFAPRRGTNNGVDVKVSRTTVTTFSSPQNTRRTATVNRARVARPSRRPTDGMVNRPVSNRYYPTNQMVQDEIPFPVEMGAQMPVEEDYWSTELGVIEDLGTEEVAEEQSSVEPVQNDLRKPRDDRVGFKGGKSPFINTDKLEKRPLSAFRRKKVEGPMPSKNTYTNQAKTLEKKKNEVPTMVVTGPGKGSNASLAIAVILVTIFGGIVGFIVYLAFFQ